MGIQSKERQDELFDLRVERRRLLLALALAICGSTQDQKEARTILLDLAEEPAMGKILIDALGGAPEKFVDYEDVLEVARRNTTLPAHQAPSQIHVRA
ncbi:hypothetical protein [Rhodanobacter sp. FW106-PBR-R2A-1-13]|uniref:hypothetical protein n=1 Tax=Rhodanobacter sp. FW106-PBR-R2A-1-13 TaxID=3454845 RepID=UPI0034E5E648